MKIHHRANSSISSVKYAQHPLESSNQSKAFDLKEMSSKNQKPDQDMYVQGLSITKRHIMSVSGRQGVFYSFRDIHPFDMDPEPIR